MRLRSTRRRRRGGALAESVITTMVSMMMMLGMIDMGVAIFRMHVISEAARQGARRAIVHGAKADVLGSWGPAAFSGSGTSTDPRVTEVRPYMTGVVLSATTINVTWPDNGNQVEQHVKYQVSTTWTPMMTWIFGSPTYTLSASSTMIIAH